MATISNILTENGYKVDGIPQKILDLDIEYGKIETVGKSAFDLFNGFHIQTKDGKMVYSINLEYQENEFSPLAIFHHDDEGYNIGEVGYDENLNKEYEYW